MSDEQDSLFDFGPEPTEEEKMRSMEAWVREIQRQHKASKWLLFKQFMVLVYVSLCFVFLYVSIGAPYMGYTAVVLTPLVLLLLDYFMLIREKKLGTAGKRGEQDE